MCNRSSRGTLFNSFQKCIVYSRAWECSYILDDQPVRERVMASYYYTTCMVIFCDLCVPAKFKFLLLLLLNHVSTAHCKFIQYARLIVRWFRGVLLLDVSARSEPSSGDVVR